MPFQHSRYQEGDSLSQTSYRGGYVSSKDPDGPPYPENYNILIICPLGMEGKEMRKLFTESHGSHSFRGDHNVYTLGKIGQHFVALGIPGSTGTTATSRIATNAWRTFPRLKYTFLVGIGAGVPRKNRKIELGDVVIGRFVYKHDWKKEITGEKQESLGHMNTVRPPEILTQLAINTTHICSDDAVGHIKDTVHHYFTVPPEYAPTIYHEGIASGDTVVKSAEFRDKVSQGDIGCIEMEAAGMAPEHNCLTIRGISDFADASKGDNWQKLAALAAATVAAYIVRRCPQFEHEEPYLSSGYKHDRLERTRVENTPGQTQATSWYHTILERIYTPTQRKTSPQLSDPMKSRSQSSLGSNSSSSLDNSPDSDTEDALFDFFWGTSWANNARSKSLSLIEYATILSKVMKRMAVRRISDQPPEEQRRVLDNLANLNGKLIQRIEEAESVDKDLAPQRLAKTEEKRKPFKGQWQENSSTVYVNITVKQEHIPHPYSDANDA
ncbi:hypothetical protein TWF730_003706 [Orbilia blumenaviensis]|uniref:Nucleoside phosphorylase domain-containing protein n=1 Tax=Orbilia blumenaviensis TaxID=1796055 RepID=A0AAV9U6E9_9PEZI